MSSRENVRTSPAAEPRNHRIKLVRVGKLSHCRLRDSRVPGPKAVILSRYLLLARRRTVINTRRGPENPIYRFKRNGMCMHNDTPPPPSGHRGTRVRFPGTAVWFLALTNKKKMAGNRTPISRATDGDARRYTTEEQRFPITILNDVDTYL